MNRTMNTAKRRNQPMSDAQRKAIWATARDQGLDSDALHDLVETETGQAHISTLSHNQASLILDRLTGQEGHPGYRSGTQAMGYGRTKYNNLATRKGMATPAQLRKIEAMWADRARAADRDASLRQFLQHKFSVSDVRFLDRRRASDVIVALERMEVIL